MFFTADTHFSHGNIIKYCNRPFSSVEEMDETIIRLWNQKVGQHDTVYHLGDFMMCRGYDAESRMKRLASRLNGEIHLIVGNHDDPHVCYQSGAFKSVRDYRKINWQKQKIILFHYSMRVWDCSHHGAWQLYGHSHGTLPDIGGLTFDVGVDSWGYAPLHYEEIRIEMLSRQKIMLGSDDHHMEQLK